MASLEPSSASIDPSTTNHSVSPNLSAENGISFPPSVAPKTIDPDFYIQGVFVVFEVEGYLFRVPTHLILKESEFFRDLFELPQEEGNFEGASADKPIVIAGIQREDFRNLLKILYPISVQKTKKLSKAEWISVLNLSTMWYFENLKKIAISELESLASLTSLEKIVLGRKCGVSSWVLAGYTELVSKSETLNDEEVEAVDYRTAVKLFRLRENRLKGSYNWASDIKTAFEGELLSVER